jgi:hypothetical protein
MGLGTVRHSRKKIGKAHYKMRTFNVQVRVVREPTYVRGTIYGQKVKKEPAYRATACVMGTGSRGGRRGYTKDRMRCGVGDAHGPTAAVRKALAKLSKTVK